MQIELLGCKNATVNSSFIMFLNLAGAWNESER
jgi:hypothetical protein